MKFIADWTFTYPSQPVEGEGIFAPQGTPTELIQVVVVHRVFPKSIGVWKIDWIIYILDYVTSGGPLVDFR